jgi:hypothetical protein
VDIASKRLGKKVGILNPQTHPAIVLKQAATFFKQIRQGVLRDSQFPHVLTDADGTFRKPAAIPAHSLVISSSPVTNISC